MAKEAGLGATLTIDDSGTTGRDISDDVGDVVYDVSRGDIQVPAIDESAMARLQGIADCSVSVNGYFNDASGASSFDVFKNAGSTEVIRTTAYALSGQTFSIEAYITGVQWSRARDGGMNFAATLMLGNGTDPAWS